MALGADYSWARPGGAALAAAGVEAVGRYLASDGRGITAAEYQDLQAHGVGVWLVREGSAAGMLGGFPQGVADAQIAVQQIAAAGLPANSVVHTAADWDVQTSQFPLCDAYQDGFASVLGGYQRVGAYGGLHWLNHVHAVGKAVSFWKAGASSWDQGEAPQMPLNFVQTTLAPPLPGTDHNYINATTTLAGSSAILLEDDLPDMNEFLNTAAWTGGPSISQFFKNMGVAHRAVQRDGRLVEQIQDNADTNTMVRQLIGRPSTAAPAVDVEALAAAIVAKLPATNLTKQDVIDVLNTLVLRAS